VYGVQEARHFLRGFALHAHGDAEGSQFQVAYLAVEHLAKEVVRRLARQCAGAVFAATDFLEVVRNAHGGIFGVLI